MSARHRWTEINAAKAIDRCECGAKRFYVQPGVGRSVPASYRYEAANGSKCDRAPICTRGSTQKVSTEPRS